MPYPLNANYGKGIFRRSIRLEKHHGKVSAELEDCNHAFHLSLSYSDKIVTDVSATPVRYPVSTCPDSIKQLQTFIGKKLTDNRLELRNYAAPNKHCTHIYDLVGLTMAHALRDEKTRQYDIAIPDLKDNKTIASLYRNKQLILQWPIENDRIVASDKNTEGPIMKGFTYWAMKQFKEEQLEAAFILQMGYFVASARRYAINSMAGEKVLTQRIPINSCYSYSSGIIENAIRMANSMRDFTDNEEEVLQFKEPL